MTLVQLVSGGSNLGAPPCVSQSRAKMDALDGRPGLPAPHKFHVSEIVNFFRPVSRNVPGGAYEVIQQLLHNGREFEYRIKSANEEHQPMAGESELTKL
jgi:hypothetical protein